ncbi:MAG TPA: carbohydrate-binding protein, partial [Candidatus Cloacimonadota bacterium]|nr:carbohydrate-binding protein [Candidatus Cloacimonadota bacterium]
MKKTSLLIIIMILIGVVQAAFLKDFPQSLQQPDGTRFEAYRSGDEFYNWLHDTEGYTIVQNDQGYYVYAEAAPDGIRP